MKLSQTPLAASLFAAASLTVLTSTSRAATYTEPTTDAGQTLATAANAGTPTEIDGTLSSQFDADLYMVTLSTAGSYTFSTNNTYTNVAGTDTELSLFTSTGVALLLDDDASNTAITSTITDTLTAGIYYIGVASSGNEPVNSASQLLFAEPTGSSLGDTTIVRGPASGVNPTTLATFNSGNTYYDGSGPYHITISAPAVPEPSTWAALALGSIAAGFTILRRRSV